MNTPSISKQKVMFGEISLNLHQTKWNVARNDVNVVVDELPSQITVCTCLTIDLCSGGALYIMFENHVRHYPS